MRRFAATVLGAMLLILPACGSKTDEASRAPGITPANAIAMVSVNLSPSIEQKRNLLSIARNFPGARDKVKGEFDDARDDVLGEMLDGSGLDYARDVKPWLGKELAVAILPGVRGSPRFVAMVQTDDKDQATAAIAKATKSGEFDGVYGIVEDFVVISDQDDPDDNQSVLDLIAAQARKGDGGLAKSAEFTKVVDQLHGDRLVLGWVNAKDAVGAAEDLGVLGASGFLEGFGMGAGTLAFDLHAEQKAVVFQGVASTTGGEKGSTIELTRSLPASTLAALTMLDVGGSITKAITAVTGTGSDATAELEQAIGLDLEDDILSWMKGEVVIVAGAVRGQQPFPDFAVVVEPTDKAKAAAGVTKIRAKLAEKGFPLEERKVGDTTAYGLADEIRPGIQPAMALFPDRFVVANSPSYLEELATSATPGLGDSDAYASVLGKASGGTSVQFVAIIDPIREAIEKILATASGDMSSYEKDTKPNLEPLSAFGVRAHRDGDFNKFEMRLTFD